MQFSDFPSYQGKKGLDMSWGILNNSKSGLLALLVSIFTFFIYCSSNLAGSEVTNEKTAVYMPGGKQPAAQALVQIVPVDHIPGSGKVDSTITDNNGAYSVSGIPEGYYNIIATKDTLASLLDSIYIKNGVRIPDDTLEMAGSLTAWVKLQPDKNPRSVIVQVIGTAEYYTNVDSSGKFTLSNIAEGSYQLRLEITQDPDYITTFKNIRIRAGIHDTLYDSIEMIYNGIPVVTGLTAQYDEKTSVITVKWDQTNYSDLNDYAVFRDSPDSMKLSESPIAYVKSAVFYDTLKNQSKDTFTILRYRYRVAVRNRSLIEGKTFRYATVTAVSGNKKDLILQSDYLQFVPSSPCTLKMTPDKALGKVINFYWSIGEFSQFKQVSGPDTVIIVNIAADSVLYGYPCVAKVITEEGVELSDTIYLQSELVWEKTAESPLNNAIGYYSVSLKGLIYLFTSFLNGSDTLWSCWNSTDGISWNKANDSLPCSIQKKPLSFKDNLFIFERKTALSSSIIWYSQDGVSWNSSVIDSISNSGYSSEYEILTQWGERLILLNYYPSCLPQNSCGENAVNCWESFDGLKWNSLNINKSLFPDRYDTPNSNFVSGDLNGKLYVGGAWRAIGLKKPVWEAYGFRIWNLPDDDPVTVSYPVPVDTNKTFDNLIAEIAIYKGRLFLTSSEDSASMWVKTNQDFWIRCCNSYPGGLNRSIVTRYHTMCVNNDRLYSISNAGVWVLSK